METISYNKQWKGNEKNNEQTSDMNHEDSQSITKEH